MEDALCSGSVVGLGSMCVGGSVRRGGRKGRGRGSRRCGLGWRVGTWREWDESEIVEHRICVGRCEKMSDGDCKTTD